MILAAIGSRDWVLALKYAFRVYHDVDPVLFPRQWHAVRVVHSWVMVRLMMQCAESNVHLPVVGADRNVAWHLVVGKLWREVMEALPKSHGVESTLAKEVAAFGAQMKDMFKEGEMMYGGGRFREVTAEEWAMLRARLESWIGREGDEEEA